MNMKKILNRIDALEEMAGPSAKVGAVEDHEKRIGALESDAVDAVGVDADTATALGALSERFAKLENAVGNLQRDASEDNTAWALDVLASRVASLEKANKNLATIIERVLEHGMTANQRAKLVESLPAEMVLTEEEEAEANG